MANDDVAGLNDSQLLAEKEKLKGRALVLRDAENKGAISPSLMVELHDVESRLSRVEARIEFRMRQGTV